MREHQKIKCYSSPTGVRKPKYRQMTSLMCLPCQQALSLYDRVATTNSVSRIRRRRQATKLTRITTAPQPVRGITQWPTGYFQWHYCQGKATLIFQRLSQWRRSWLPYSQVLTPLQSSSSKFAYLLYDSFLASPYSCRLCSIFSSHWLVVTP